MVIKKYVLRRSNEYYKNDWLTRRITYVDPFACLVFLLMKLTKFYRWLFCNGDGYKCDYFLYVRGGMEISKVIGIRI